MQPKVESICDLPGHIVTEIISRLPWESIYNCRRVCTSWRRLVSDPHFAELCVSRSSNVLILHNTPPRSLFWVRPIEKFFVDFPRNREISVTNNAMLKFNPRSDVPISDLEVLSVCIGFIFLHKPTSFSPFYICNPMINEFVIVPQTEKESFEVVGSGFGFSPTRNQFKILRFLCPTLGSGLLSSKVELEINTVGTDLWRNMGEAPANLHMPSGGVYVNGALHWIIQNSEYFESIVCFDVGDEKFRNLTCPSSVLQKSLLLLNLGSLLGRLTIFHYSGLDGKLDIWVMRRRYGMKDSWVKAFVIDVPVDCNMLCRPIMFLNKREILISSSFLLFSCSMSRRCFRYVKVEGLEHPFRVMPYFPSFVSIKDANIEEPLEEVDETSALSGSVMELLEDTEWLTSAFWRLMKD